MAFDKARAADYDRFMGRFSVPLAACFAAFADIDDAARVLDVGSGPGALTAVLAERLGAASVCAVDPTPAFAAAVRERLPGVDVREASAESLPFPDAAFDATLSQLVVHFMADAAAGVREMVRVTHHGGVVAANVWDFVGGRAPQTAFFRALASVVDEVEDETARAGGRDGDLVALLTQAGCRDVEQTELEVAVECATFEDWWQPYTLGVAPAGRQLAALDETTRARVREAALALLGPGPFTVSATAWAARGVV